MLNFGAAVFPTGTGTEIEGITKVTGLHIDARCMPVSGTVRTYVVHSMPDTAVFTIHPNRSTQITDDFGLLSIEKLGDDEEIMLWKSRVTSYSAKNNTTCLGVDVAWMCDCSNVKYPKAYGSGPAGFTLSVFPQGYRVIPLAQFVMCGTADPMHVFTADYVWNKSWRWGTAEDRFLNLSRIKDLLKALSTSRHVPSRLYAGSVGVLVRNNDNTVVGAKLLPIPSAMAILRTEDAHEWFTDALRSLWVDIVLGIQNTTGTTSYRPFRHSLMTKLMLFSAGAALGYGAGTLLSYKMQDPMQCPDNPDGVCDRQPHRAPRWEDYEDIPYTEPTRRVKLPEGALTRVPGSTAMVSTATPLGTNSAASTAMVRTSPYQSAPQPTMVEGPAPMQLVMDWVPPPPSFTAMMPPPQPSSTAMAKVTPSQFKLPSMPSQFASPPLAAEFKTPDEIAAQHYLDNNVPGCSEMAVIPPDAASDCTVHRMIQEEGPVSHGLPMSEAEIIDAKLPPGMRIPGLGETGVVGVPMRTNSITGEMELVTRSPVGPRFAQGDVPTVEGGSRIASIVKQLARSDKTAAIGSSSTTTAVVIPDVQSMLGDVARAPTGRLAIVDAVKDLQTGTGSSSPRTARILTDIQKEYEYWYAKNMGLVDTKTGTIDYGRNVCPYDVQSYTNGNICFKPIETRGDIRYPLMTWDDIQSFAKAKYGHLGKAAVEAAEYSVGLITGLIRDGRALATPAPVNPGTLGLQR